MHLACATSPYNYVEISSNRRVCTYNRFSPKFASSNLELRVCNRAWDVFVKFNKSFPSTAEREYVDRLRYFLVQMILFYQISKNYTEISDWVKL